MSELSESSRSWAAAVTRSKKRILTHGYAPLLFGVEQEPVEVGEAGISIVTGFARRPAANEALAGQDAAAKGLGKTV